MRDGINKQRQTYLQRERVKEREIVRRWVHKDTYKYTYRERETKREREDWFIQTHENIPTERERDGYVRFRVCSDVEMVMASN